MGFVDVLCVWSVRAYFCACERLVHVSTVICGRFFSVQAFLCAFERLIHILTVICGRFFSVQATYPHLGLSVWMNYHRPLESSTFRTPSVDNSLSALNTVHKSHLPRGRFFAPSRRLLPGASFPVPLSGALCPVISSRCHLHSPPLHWHPVHSEKLKPCYLRKFTGNISFSTALSIPRTLLSCAVVAW